MFANILDPDQVPQYDVGLSWTHTVWHPYRVIERFFPQKVDFEKQISRRRMFPEHNLLNP